MRLPPLLRGGTWLATLAVVALTSGCLDDPVSPTTGSSPDAGPALAEGTAPPTSGAQSISLFSGEDTDSDDRDDNVTVDAGSGEIAAYVIPKHPNWADAIAGTAWIGPLSNANEGVVDPGDYPFRVTFELPDGFAAPVLNLATHTDNYAVIKLNGVEIGAHDPAAANPSYFQGDPETWNSIADFQLGTNTLEIVLTNAPATGTDDGPNPAGLNFDATVTYALPPEIETISVPTDPVAASSEVTVTGTYSDPDPGDTHTGTIDWGDGTVEPLASVSGGSFSSGSHSYAEAALYTVTITITDSHGLSDTESAETQIVVYDPAAGFVTGGGWILSPEGAMPPTTTDVTISGVSGDASVDPAAAFGQFHLRHVGDPAPSGYSHSYQWATPRIVTPSPEDGPVTMQGTIDVDEQVEGQVAMIGLLDRDDLAAGNTSFQRGAYIYVHRRSATEWRIGISDGNSGGEIVQRFTTIADTDLPADGVLNVVFTVDGTADGSTCGDAGAPAEAGCMTLELTGGSVNATLTDSYGEIVGSSSSTPEFANGAVPGWDDFLGSNVAYSLTVPSVIAGSAEGKATFGFNAKYKKGANVPDGNTQFTFKTGDLDFHSTSYDWLVVTGNDYARFKGEGTINGMGSYKFMLWAGDETGTDGSDTFRMKIWEEVGSMEDVVYDNGMDQAIGGGSIIVHTKGK